MGARSLPPAGLAARGAEGLCHTGRDFTRIGRSYGCPVLAVTSR